MCIEKHEVGVMQLAKDAAGISAYKWAQTEQRIGVPSMLRRPFGVICAAGEFASPITLRINRELPSLYHDPLIRISARIKDISTFIISSGAFLAVALATDFPGAPSAALLLTKLVLNGVVHYEFTQSKK